MKKTLYLLCAVLFAASTFLASPAKAYSGDLPCQGDDPTTGITCDTPDGSTNLPINNGVIYLFIAGIAVGVIAVRKKSSVFSKA